MTSRLPLRRALASAGAGEAAGRRTDRSQPGTGQLSLHWAHKGAEARGGHAGPGTQQAMDPRLLPGLGGKRTGRGQRASPEGVCGVWGVTDVRVAMADTAAADADVLDAVKVLSPHVHGERHGPLPPPPRQPRGHRGSALTRRVTVGSRSALPMRWPSSVLVRRKRRRMLVALVKSRSRGE